MEVSSKKEEVSAESLGAMIFTGISKFISNQIEELTVREEFSVIKSDKDQFFNELIIFSFWDLTTLECPHEVFAETVKYYFKVLNISEADKIIKWNEIKRKIEEYSDAIGRGLEALIYTLSTNIHIELPLNPLSQLFLLPVFQGLDEANGKILYKIKKYIKIISANSNNSI